MIFTPRKAIRAKCLDCCCGHPSEVRICTAVKCPLYPYRMGKRPKMDGDTPEDANSADTKESTRLFTAEAKTKAPLCDDRPK